VEQLRTGCAGNSSCRRSPKHQAECLEACRSRHSATGTRAPSASALLALIPHPDFAQVAIWHVDVSADKFESWGVVEPGRRVARFLSAGFDAGAGRPIEPALFERLASAWKVHHRELTGMPAIESDPPKLTDFMRTVFARSNLATPNGTLSATRDLLMTL